MHDPLVCRQNEVNWKQPNKKQKANWIAQNLEKHIPVLWTPFERMSRSNTWCVHVLSAGRLVIFCLRVNGLLDCLDLRPQEVSAKTFSFFANVFCCWQTRSACFVWFSYLPGAGHWTSRSDLPSGRLRFLMVKKRCRHLNDIFNDKFFNFMRWNFFPFQTSAGKRKNNFAYKFTIFFLRLMSITTNTSTRP